MKMNKKYALYIIIGLAIGSVFGTAFGPSIGNTSLATGLGAVGGLYIGWFVAVAVRESESNKG
jgi:uncharacterized protein YcfJ